LVFFPLYHIFSIKNKIMVKAWQKAEFPLTQKYQPAIL